MRVCVCVENLPREHSYHFNISYYDAAGHKFIRIGINEINYSICRCKIVFTHKIQHTHQIKWFNIQHYPFVFVNFKIHSALGQCVLANSY